MIPYTISGTVEKRRWLILLTLPRHEGRPVSSVRSRNPGRCKTELERKFGVDKNDEDTTNRTG